MHLCFGCPLIFYKRDLGERYYGQLSKQLAVCANFVQTLFKMCSRRKGPKSREASYASVAFESTRNEDEEENRNDNILMLIKAQKVSTYQKEGEWEGRGFNLFNYSKLSRSKCLEGRLLLRLPGRKKKSM